MSPEGVVPILEGEVDPGKDVVSFGAVECDHAVCVRASSVAGSLWREAPASGRCSRFCEDESATCDSAEASVKLSCRALALDEETLRRLREKYPARWGRVAHSHLCAEPP